MKSAKPRFLSATLNMRITRLAQGIPMGGEPDYLNDGTLSAALSARLPY